MILTDTEASILTEHSGVVSGACYRRTVLFSSPQQEEASGL